MRSSNLLHSLVAPIAAFQGEELKMATALIDAMTSEWDPTKYKDQYQNALMQLIEEKAQKHAPSPKPAAPRVQPNVIDMVAVLQQSLQRAGVKKKSASANGRSARFPRSTAGLVKRSAAPRPPEVNEQKNLDENRPATR